MDGPRPLPNAQEAQELLDKHDPMGVKLELAAREHGTSTASCRRALKALCRFDLRGTGTCWPSHASIAREADCSRKTAARAMRALQAAGILKAEKRIVEGRRTSNRYRLDLEISKRRRPGHHRRDAESQQKVETTTTKNPPTPQKRNRRSSWEGRESDESSKQLTEALGKTGLEVTERDQRRIRRQITAQLAKNADPALIQQLLTDRLEDANDPVRVILWRLKHTDLAESVLEDAGPPPLTPEERARLLVANYVQAGLNRQELLNEVDRFDLDPETARVVVEDALVTRAADLLLVP
jgi:DNA-binding Lrp family transcriptional regulator